MDADLESVERRRILPTRVTQWIQVTLQNRVVRGILESREQPAVPSALRLLDKVPLLQRLPARLIGLGVRPEHVATRAMDSQVLNGAAPQRGS
jgi:hypothetical protein